MAEQLAEQLAIISRFLMEVDMFPVFFLAHFTMASILVRDDSKDLGPRFRENHPFALWFCTVMASLSGVFVANFLFGDPLIDILKENLLITFISVVWYLVNYCPYDAVFKLVTLEPVRLVGSLLQECLRLRFIYLGLLQAHKVYPGAYVIILLGGVIKGNGYGFIKIIERLIRGKWAPATNEILDVTYFAKSSLYASILFLLQHLKLLDVPVEYLYSGVLAAFITCRLIIMYGGVKDPLLVLESPVYTVLFGSWSETGQANVTQRPPSGQTSREKIVKKIN